jgi:DNA-3-methyladenine glycosylase
VADRRKLPRAFYDRPAIEVARALIGKVLVHRARVLTAGVIVEVEAYIGESDPACHAAPGRTARNAPLYGPPGHAYVYLNYGLHQLFNVVVEAEGRPAAILVRALAPLEGVEHMRRRRGVRGDDDRLCSGPGNLTRAMGITLADNRRALTGDRLFLEDRKLGPMKGAWSTRIGIRVGTDRAWRCYVPGNPSVSGPPALNASPGAAR